MYFIKFGISLWWNGCVYFLTNIINSQSKVVSDGMWFKVLFCTYVQSATLWVLAICPRKECEPRIPYLVLPCSFLSCICSVPWPANPSAKSEGPVCVDMSLDACRPYPQATPGSEASPSKNKFQFLPLWYVKLTSLVVHSVGVLVLHLEEGVLPSLNLPSREAVPLLYPKHLKSKNLSARPGALLPCSLHPPCSLLRYPPISSSDEEPRQRCVFPETFPTLEPQNCWLTPLLLWGGLGPHLSSFWGNYPFLHTQDPTLKALIECSLPDPGYFVVILNNFYNIFLLKPLDFLIFVFISIIIMFL